MPLVNPNPIVTEPIPAKEFPHIWLSNINISAPATTSGSVSIITIPYNGDTGELGSGRDSVKITTDKLWEAVQEVPEVAAAMQAIINATEPLREWIELKKAEEMAELDVDTP